MKRIILTILAIIMLPISIFAISGEEIVRLADEAQTFKTAKSSGEFQVTDRFGTKITSFNSWARGESESFIEFTSRAERGQKILRTKDEIYLYYPDAEELIRMQGSALRQGVLGSDISYEDMTGGKDRAKQYTIEITGEEKVLGRDCWILKLTAKTRTVPYPKEIVWIDKKSYLVLKGEYYTKSDRLLKEMEVLEIGIFDNIETAARTRISDTMKSDSETVLVLKTFKANVALDNRIFSLEELW
ncbi:MAG: outer membrane lipoprotein-sorting protein [Spirochaetales bacterium]|nr:outer membrane lipoprotein-sorting protein [Spirochaetales bacterium]